MVNNVNIPNGYKQTEVGIIPSDWVVSILGDNTKKIGSGITPTGGEKVYKKEGKPFLRSQNVGWGNLLLDDIAYIDDSTHNSFISTEIEKNDVFLNITGASIGRSAVADERVISGNVNQHVCIIRPFEEELNSKFLNYFLLSKEGQRQIDSFQAGGNRKGLNFGQIKSFKIPLPPIPEQEAIAEVLGDVDALITALDALLVKKRNIKQGAMQQLLTSQKRLPGFTGKWDRKKLEECLIRPPDYGINASAVPYSDNLPVYIRITDISDDGKFIKNNRTSVKHSDADKYILYMNDMVFARTGASTGKTYLYNPFDGKLVFAGFLIRVKINTSILIPQFLKSFTETNSYWKWVKIMSMRSGQPGINGREFSQMMIPLPPLPEQEAIAQVLSDMDAEIESLENKRRKIVAIKTGMMHRLLTGKTRLK